jgi:Pyridoxamine 5'-phosphate oxidase
MPIALSPEVKQLIDRPNFAHLATLMPDGSPQSVPVWVGREVEHIVICTGGARLRGRTRGATREWRCRSSTSQIPTRKFRFAAASLSGAPIPT